MYRHVVEWRSRIYLQMNRRNIGKVLMGIIIDMLLDRTVDYNDVISMTAKFEDCFPKVMEEEDFKLPFSHTKSEKDLESYRQLVCDRAIVASTTDMKGHKCWSVGLLVNQLLPLVCPYGNQHLKSEDWTSYFPIEMSQL